VFVLFTEKDSAAAALRTAGAFVAGLGGEIIIAATQIVPYPLPLNRPPTDCRALIAQIAGSISQSGIAFVTPPKALIAYARDSSDGWLAILPPHCIVVVGRPKRSLVQRFRNWLAARFLRHLGHEVLLA
jgi:hypothetical protein